MMQRWFGLLAGFTAMSLGACAESPAGAPSAQPAASASASEVAASEAPSPSAPIPTASASVTSEVAVLSAEKPPVPPRRPSVDAKALAIANELQQLDMDQLKSLSSSGVPIDSVLRDGARSDKLLSDLTAPAEAGRGRASGLNLGGGGVELRASSGGGAGLAALGTPLGPGSTIGGKSAKDLTAADVDKALGRASCSTTRLDSPSSPSDGPTVALFEAKCPANSFTITFVPAGAKRPDAKAIAEMDRLGATWSDSGMLLAIMPKEKDARPAAIELLNKLRTETTSAPRGQAAVGGASVAGGSVSNAGAVVAGMAAGFRRCYNRGLQEDPNMKGSVRITAKIGSNGEVLSASPSGGGGLSTAVTGCIAGVVSSRQFSPPDGGNATIVIPVSFTPTQ